MGYSNASPPVHAVPTPESRTGSRTAHRAGTGAGAGSADPVAAALEAGLVMAPGSALEATVRLAAAAAGRDCPVFLHGESGSGKELLAAFVHRGSGRRGGPFVAVNCAAIAPQLIESELFGHRRGAFTGAVEDRPGRFREAEGGTLFLDEVGDMPLEVQTKLLRALQEKAVSPVGDRREYPVDFRLVCATHKDLRRAVREGRFREDLYYRVAVVEIRLPPLRERPGDIPALLRRFLSAQVGQREAEAALADFPPELLRLPFPGNVRELRNLAERYAVALELGGGWREAAAGHAGVAEELQVPAPEGAIPQEGIAAARPIAAHPDTAIPVATPPDAAPGRRVRNSRVTEEEILRALGDCGWHRDRASRLLGISRRALQYRLAKMARI